LLVDIDELTPAVEESDLLTHLVNQGSPAAVQAVWVGGRQVVGDGQVLALDVAELRSAVTARARSLAAG
jgi:cytosine/adenosine deaminase-related metal-dependent hydrolase